jgi:selenide,water dikinase
MLPGLVAGLYVSEDTHIDMRPLCGFADAGLVLDEAIGIDLPARRVICASGSPLDFDLLSIDIGSTPNTRSVPGAAAHAIPVKPIDSFLLRFEAGRRRILERRGEGRIAVAGAGAAGVELMLAIEHRLRKDAGAASCDARKLSFTLISADADILKTYPRRLRARFREILAARGIELIAGRAAVRVEDGDVCLEGGQALPFDELFWATEGSPASWLEGTGLALDSQGYIAVGPTLESISHPGVFAAGDVASFQPQLPKAGVYAVREGPVLSANLRSAAAGARLKAYKPQGNILSLISTGERYALGARNGLTFEGRWVWHWKDWIDRRFMLKLKTSSARAFVE